MGNLFKVGTNIVAGGFVVGMLGDIIKSGRDKNDSKNRLHRKIGRASCRERV